MAIWFDLIDGTPVTFARFEGEIAPAMVAEALRAYFDDPRIPSPRQILADVSAIIDFEPSYNDMVEVVQIASAAFGAETAPVRIALAAEAEVPFGRASLFEMLSANEPRLEVTLHRSLTEAARAIGLPEGTPLTID